MYTCHIWFNNHKDADVCQFWCVGKNSGDDYSVCFCQAAVWHALNHYAYRDAVFLAERLYAEGKAVNLLHSLLHILL